MRQNDLARQEMETYPADGARTRNIVTAGGRLALLAGTVILLGLLIALPAFGGDGYRTGDRQLDGILDDLDRSAKVGLGDFARKMGQRFEMPPEMVDWMLKKAGMSPGDAYMAAKVAKVSGRTVEEVVDAYKANKGKGWGTIARKMGIKPGSAEFHALKAGSADFAGSEKKKGKGKKKAGKGKGKKGK